MRPLSDTNQRPERGDLLARARVATANQDQHLALQLLRDMAEVHSIDDALGALRPVVGDALVATARGARRDEADRVALTRLNNVESTRAQVIQLLERTRFGSADLAAIREVVSALEAAARQAEEQGLLEEGRAGDATPGRRVGSVWLEMK